MKCLLKHARWALAVSLLLTSRMSRAEPPMMKEQSVRPRIEARSEDGRHSVALGGFIQGRYTLEFQDTTLMESRIDTPRTRLYLFGHVHSTDVRYRLMIGTPPSGLDVGLYDAYIDYRAHDAFRLRVGHFKVPVYREWIESARMLASVERTILTQTLLPGRDWGGMVAGDLFSGHIDYSVGLFHGGKAQNDKGARIAGRLAWNALGRSIEGEIDFENSPRALVIGLSGVTSFDSSQERDAAGGVEIAYRERGLDVTVEAMGRERRTLGGDASLIAGFYARADKYVPSLRASLGGRVTHMVGLNKPMARTEIDVDAVYYPAQHDLKVATNVGLGRLRDEGTWKPFLMVQVQAGF